MPLSSLPTEILQQSLQCLPNLGSLQSAILTAPFLYTSFVGNRRLVLKYVFLTQILTLKGDDAEEDSTWEKTSRSIIRNCSAKNGPDGLLLREAIWPCIQSLDKFQQVLSWGSELASAYRLANREDDASSVDEYVWQRLAHIELSQEGFDWAEAVILEHHRQGKRATALSMQWEIWERVKGMKKNFFWGLHLAKSLRVAGFNVYAIDLLKSIWQLVGPWGIRSIVLACGRALISAYRENEQNSEALIFQEGVWHQLRPRRGGAFNLWSIDLAEAYRRNGHNAIPFQERVWRMVSASAINSEALDWARRVIQSYKEQGRRAEALAFQESVWNSMDRAAAAAPYDAWGRNLSTRYLQAGEFPSALRIQERMWRQLTPQSPTYFAWGRELVSMYLRAERPRDALGLEEQMWDVCTKKQSDFHSSCLAYSLTKAYRQAGDEAKALRVEAQCKPITA